MTDKEKATERFFKAAEIIYRKRFGNFPFVLKDDNGFENATLTGDPKDVDIFNSIYKALILQVCTFDDNERQLLKSGCCSHMVN